MKPADNELISVLNNLLKDELSSINHYMAEAELCDNWGYRVLHDEIERYAQQEMRHAAMLLERIVFFEGIPDVDDLPRMPIGTTVPDIVQNVLDAEEKAWKDYNEAIAFAHEIGDQATTKLLRRILRDEEEHINWAEAQLTQMQHMGLACYLQTKVGEEEED